jgi:hypothetical protein
LLFKFKQQSLLEDLFSVLIALLEVVVPFALPFEKKICGRPY